MVVLFLGVKNDLGSISYRLLGGYCGVGMGMTDKEILEHYKDKPCFYGDPNFMKYWRLLREEEYRKNKENGIPDPLDVFDDYEGKIITPIPASS